MQEEVWSDAATSHGTPRMAGTNQKLGRGRKASSPKPSEGAQPCWHLDFGFLASRTLEDKVSTVEITQCLMTFTDNNLGNEYEQK